MEGKEIIENMSKSLAVLAHRSSAVNVGSLRIQLKYPTAGGAGDSSTLDSWANRELADKSLIREAFHTANKTGLTPSQLQLELEKAKELLKDVEKWGAEFGLDAEIYSRLSTFLEGSGNKTK